MTLEQILTELYSMCTGLSECYDLSKRIIKANYTACSERKLEIREMGADEIFAFDVSKLTRITDAYNESKEEMK